jgi:putative methyltransferase (TIGR04325 family)
MKNFKHVKNRIKKFILSISIDLLKRKQKPSIYGWFGNYSSWAEALKDNRGYDSDEILEKVKNSMFQVKMGASAYERDSVLFDTVQYSWPLLAGLLWIAAQNCGRLHVLDFGGSLGTSFYQNRLFLNELSEVQWCIVEQKKFVECGKKYFANNTLRFYFSIEDCLAEIKPSVIILSSVLQYIEKPYKLLREIFRHEFEYIIVDLTGFVYDNYDRITIQKVPPEIYNASYPCWFFNEKKFLEFMETKYNLIVDFRGFVGQSINIDDAVTAGYKGFIFQRAKKLSRKA